MANLLREMVELLKRFGARFLGHPVESLQALAENDFQILDQLVHAHAGARWKMFLHKKLPESLANLGIDHLSGALPTRFLLWLTAQGCPIKGERFVLRRSVQKWGSA